MPSAIKSLDDKELTTFMVGQLAQAWAFLEITLDSLVFITFKVFGRKDIHNEIPRSLKRKLTFLRAIFAKRDYLRPMLPAISHLVAAVKRCSAVRHDCIHGTVHPTDYQEKFFHYRIADYHAEHITIRDSKMSHKEIIEVMRESLQLTQVIFATSSYLNALLSGDDKDRASLQFLQEIDRIPSPRESVREFARLLRKPSQEG